MAEAKPHLVFAVGPRNYAVAAGLASEILTPGPLTQLPGAGPHLLGMLAHRGEVVPVVDLALLRGEPSTPWERGILVRLGRGAFALSATRVLGVMALEGVGRRLAETGVEALLSGPFTVRGEDAVLLDAEGLFDRLAQSGSSAT